MAQYSIGEVEELTGIKPYVLRYWEEVIPGFAPQKDAHGRRLYTQREIDLIRRMKYLIYTKRYTIDGARSQLIRESERPDTVHAGLEAIRQIRESLGTARALLAARRKERDTRNGTDETRQ